MLEPPLGGGAGERHVQRMPETCRRLNLPETQTAPGHISRRETADRPILKYEIPVFPTDLAADLQTAIQHAVSSQGPNHSYWQIARS